MRRFEIKGEYVDKIPVYGWDEVDNPKGVVQFIHGFNEHHERFIDLAKVFNEQGYLVYMNEHYEHGAAKVREISETTFFDGKKPRNKYVDGAKTMFDWIKEQHPNLKHIAYGYSYGAILTRYLVQEKLAKYDAVVLIGAMHFKNLTKVKVARNMAKVLTLTGPESPSKMFDSQLFGGIKKALKAVVPETRHYMEALTRDKQQLKKFMRDESLRRRTSVSTFHMYTQFIIDTDKKSKLKKFDKDTKLLLLSGSHDPVTEMGETTIHLHDIYRNFGVKNVKYKIYFEARHELHSELNKEEIFEDIFSWLDENLR